MDITLVHYQWRIKESLRDYMVNQSNDKTS
jgi:hypothetical protein